MTNNNIVKIKNKETGRVEAFSDGVFSIAITLLVLNLKIPDKNTLSASFGLLEALLVQWPEFMAFLISFITILIMWVNHHNMFNHIKLCDQNFLFLNGFVLLTVTFIPYPTALLANYIKTDYADIASAIFAGAFLLNCISFNILWHYVSYEKRLLDENINPDIILKFKRNGLIGLPLYLIAILAAFINVTLSVGICTALAIFFSIAGFFERE
ncbi:DUF1211 domain-containing protein [Candidatus Desantisbacteria bacterium]|nr:DUF1211 domain-containing protein [Candidatus Desantisbacteria bacterium]